MFPFFLNALFREFLKFSEIWNEMRLISFEIIEDTAII